MEFTLQIQKGIIFLQENYTFRIIKLVWLFYFTTYTRKMKDLLLMLIKNTLCDVY